MVVKEAGKEEKAGSELLGMWQAVNFQGKECWVVKGPAGNSV